MVRITNDAEGKVTWKRLEEKEVKETTKANKKLVERGFKAFVEIPKNGVVRVQYSEPNDSLLSKILLNGKEQKLTTIVLNNDFNYQKNF